MQTENKTPVYNALIYIIACCLGGKKVEKELLSHVELGNIYTAAKNHSLIAIAATALEEVQVFSARASDLKNNSIRKNMLFDSERAEILKEFESRGIKYLPLKGVFLKDLYPSVGLRQMADNDILFDAEYRSVVRDIFLSRGYEIEHYEEGNHDVYIKEPIFNFEMHVSLFSNGEMAGFYEYYKDAFSIAKKDVGHNYSYSLSDEDFYVYLKAHEYKHYINSGTGIRSLSDVFVFLKAKESSLDFDYINRECEKLGILEYERLTRELAFKVLNPEVAKEMVLADRGEGDSPLTDTEAELLLGFTDSATYGTREKFLINLVEKERKRYGTSARKAKLIYILKIIFPDMKYYRKRFPKASKCKLLIPFLWVIRGFIVVFKRPVRTLRTITEVAKAKTKK